MDSKMFENAVERFLICFRVKTGTFHDYAAKEVVKR